LRKAASIFAAHPGRYTCLQARLQIYNSRQSWLTRQFALEYATLFHAMLPALAALAIPIPLSGTSNHFPRDVLENAHWDPFNVTEDADLGIRLTRLEGAIGLIESDTLEEAPAVFREWLPQRTRWFKGWLQTYLVHTREPWRLLRELGPWRTAGFHAVFGGYLISALAYPWVFVVLVLELREPFPFATIPGSLHHFAIVTAIMAFITGVSASLFMAIVGCRRDGLRELGWNIWAMPLYWMLISVAAYRAVLQFIWRPHLWEKTPHSARRVRNSNHSNRIMS
jgi:cellulose synthase/poly-beta-1,6-N-acetylglucosamine synthase-like glycosyltransferase